MKKNILLTGVSGTVGAQVFKQLLDQGNNNITVFSRASKTNKKLFRPYKNKINIVYGDMIHKDEVIAACKNQDIIIHNAAIIPPLADEKVELANDVNVNGTQNLVNALEEFSPRVFFIYSSSVAIYGDRLQNPDIRISDPLAPSTGDEYAKTKIKAEGIVKNSKLDWTIFRLPAVMGSNNHKISKLMFHMPLDTPIEIATPEDTGRALVKACNHKDELNKKIFNLGGGENCRITYKKLLSESFRIFGLGKLTFPEKAFAEKNFHCGYYADGINLENILHFRQDTIDDYFERLKQHISPLKRALTSIVKIPVKKFLLKHSEPLKAFKEKDLELIERFFN